MIDEQFLRTVKNNLSPLRATLTELYLFWCSGPRAGEGTTTTNTHKVSDDKFIFSAAAAAAALRAIPRGFLIRIALYCPIKRHTADDDF